MAHLINQSLPRPLSRVLTILFGGDRTEWRGSFLSWIPHNFVILKRDRKLPRRTPFIPYTKLSNPSNRDSVNYPVYYSQDRKLPRRTPLGRHKPAYSLVRAGLPERSPKGCNRRSKAGGGYAPQKKCPGGPTKKKTYIRPFCCAKREEATYPPHCTVGGISQVPPAPGASRPIPPHPVENLKPKSPPTSL